MRGLRDWLPLVIPLLVGGLERALQLAEAMTARGFAGADQQNQPVWTRLALVVGLSLLLAGWLLRLAWGYAALGLGLLLAGVALIILTLWREGQRVPRTVYRPAPWTGTDWVVVAAALLSAAMFVIRWPGLDRSSIFYYPYPALSMPSFSVVIGAATLGLVVPVLFLQRASRKIPVESATGGTGAAVERTVGSYDQF
jgi:energy-coupling factor transport system permease protein